MTFAIGPTGIWQGEPEELAAHHCFDPGVAAWIRNFLPQSVPVFDLGCGLGGYVTVLRNAGFDAVGIDGKAYAPHVYGFDLTLSLPRWVHGNVLCLEVAEHIPSWAERSFLRNVVRACTDHAYPVASHNVGVTRG